MWIPQLETAILKYLQYTLASPVPWLLIAWQECFLCVQTPAVAALVFLQIPLSQSHRLLKKEIQNIINLISKSNWTSQKKAVSRVIKITVLKHGTCSWSWDLPQEAMANAPQTYYYTELFLYLNQEATLSTIYTHSSFNIYKNPNTTF